MNNIIQIKNNTIDSGSLFNNMPQYQNNITKSYETKTDILELWKKLSDNIDHLTGYEAMIKQREKSFIQRSNQNEKK